MPASGYKTDAVTTGHKIVGVASNADRDFTKLSKIRETGEQKRWIVVKDTTFARGPDEHLNIVRQALFLPAKVLADTLFCKIIQENLMIFFQPKFFRVNILPLAIF